MCFTLLRCTVRFFLYKTLSSSLFPFLFSLFHFSLSFDLCSLFHGLQTHTHTYKITLFNLECPPQLTERVRQRERDWGRWGRCKVINYLWLKSNKRKEFRSAASILTDRQNPYLLKRHNIIILWKTKLKYENINIMFCVCFPWYSNTFATTVWWIQLFFSQLDFNQVAVIIWCITLIVHLHWKVKLRIKEHWSTPSIILSSL